MQEMTNRHLHEHTDACDEKSSLLYTSCVRDVAKQNYRRTVSNTIGKLATVAYTVQLTYGPVCYT